jgi:hypothetical protein
MSAYAEDPDPVYGNGDAAKKDPSSVVGTIPQIDLKFDYKVSALLPKVPASLPTYLVQRVDPTSVDPSRDPVAQAFHFEAKARGTDKSEDGASSMMLIDADHRSLEYFSSGAVFYMEQELFSERADDILAAQKLDRDSAAKRYAEQANELLTRHGLARKGMYLKDVSFTEVKSMGYQDRVETVKTVGAAAHYGYNIGKIPAWGPGAKTTVYFGPNGISGFYDALPDLVPAKEVGIRSATSALQSYMEQETPRTLYRLHTGAVHLVDIEQVELVYYVDAGNRNQHEVAPYYLIQGTFYALDVSSEKGGENQAEFVWLEPASS